MKTEKKEVEINAEDHKILALWAASCAEHVLFQFEENYKDDRPRKAIEAARAWVNGQLKMTEARKSAFAAHDAARDANIPKAIAAARSAGHAAATAHVASHARYAASYALKTAVDKEKERAWQLENLDEKYWPIVAL